jgi:hypothetical protein
MSTSTRTSTAHHGAEVVARRRSPLFAALIGLVGVTVLLQGLWAGIFLEHDGKRDAAGNWIDVHARGGEVAILLAVIATVVAFVTARARKDLWMGGLALALLLVLESWIGGLIRDDGKDILTAVHVPLAMALMGLVAWLSFRAGKR